MRIGYWRRTLIGTGLAVAVAGIALAQQPPVRIRGEIEKVDGNTLTVKARDGAMLTVNVPDNVRVMNFVKASLADIKPNSYIGVTAMPQPDGSQKAIAIHIFLEAQRGTGEGHRPWDLRPGSTMTNAAVETTAGSVDGQVLTVKYKSGDKTDEKKVIVPPDAAIVTYAPADKSELKAGAHLEGEVLANLSFQDANIDNMEGIAVRRGAKGETLFYLISDDNFSPLQRTLLLMFELKR